MATPAEFLDELSAHLKNGSGVVAREEDGHISFDSALGVTTIGAGRDPDVPIGDQTVGTAFINTAPDWPASTLARSHLARANSWAGMSALSTDGKSGRFLISTRLSWGPEVRSNVMAHLAYSIALMQADTTIGLLQLLRGEPVEPFDLAGRAEPIETLHVDFERAKEHLGTLGILAFPDSRGLTAELPMRAGEHSMLLGHLTSLLELEGTLSHPILGRGLAYRLTLPQEFETGHRDLLADMLNYLEAMGRLPAGPGAWGEGKLPQTLGFSGFIPTFAYPKGLAVLVVDWVRRKHNSASFVVENMSARGGRDVS